ncbi:hypothetical protein LEP1GSC202_0331 [Leptospira yanagawae serovar Saopaulo str. Sao Paulo = ATCC 700523]|uniref:Uncharacterized protein n=2 Tax=Leptospira yanagawae TaxID=293069 RepID=A0A5E8H9J2_9LEPT|nr:hypothetical protein LEP1GSC202_0331 [Leptospira yanagawae serovar Saopaulo str. Sao Paulo = ATCC 700523]
MNFNFLNISIWTWLIAISGIALVIFTFINEKVNNDEKLKEKDELINELKNIITGGDSYFFFQPQIVSGSNRILLLYKFSGKYSIYDSSIQIHEYDLIQLNNLKYNYQKVNTLTVNHSTLNPLIEMNYLLEVQIPNHSSPNSQFGKKYFMTIASRNGLIEEDIIIRKEGNNQPTIAYKVISHLPKFSESYPNYDHSTIKARNRHIDPAFPVHELDHTRGDSSWTAKFEFFTGSDLKINESEER